MRGIVKVSGLLSLAAWVGCGGETTLAPAPTLPVPEPAAPEPAPPLRMSPPESAAPRDIQFPPLEHARLASGLDIDVAHWTQVPIAYAWLVVKSGAETDPADQPGLAQLTANMLKEGTRSRSSAALAEEIEFLGADLSVGADQENTYITMRATTATFEKALELLADIAQNPAFRQDELAKLKRRELDRLALSANDPRYLVRREFFRAAYGSHPYARVDTTPAEVARVRTQDLARWHRTYFVPNNAVLIVVGDVTTEAVRATSERLFGRWRPGAVPDVQYPAPPTRSSREVVLVDRPESDQSMIWIGNLGLERASSDYVPLLVANQVLGGSAASRLFMDLRERRSLTYGAYSTVDESVKTGVFFTSASVRTEVTGDAVAAFFEHLGRIRSERVPDAEFTAAHRYLSDSFPLQIDTPGKIAGLIADLRVFGLADNYWDGYRSAVRAVTADQALAAATRYVDPDHALVVVVGRAAQIVEPLRQWGPVRVLDREGNPVP